MKAMTPKKWMVGIFMIYLLWMHTCDRKAGTFSSRKSFNFIKLTSIPANYLKKHYFPARLFRDFSDSPALIDGNKKYVIAFHPHGIMGISVFLHFLLTNDGLPELDYRIVTVSFNFWIPFIRELLLWLGMADASRATIQSLLARNKSVGIVIGGAAEAMNSRPGTNDLTLSTRIGFIQCAIQSGADIIPVFTFGENDLYEPLISNAPGSLLNRLQLWFKHRFSFVIPLIKGSFGLLPQRKPMHTVIGKPIRIEQNSNPSLQQILSVHQIYVKCLQDLYDRWKHLYPQRRNELNIIDKVSERKMTKWKQHIDTEPTLAKL